MGKEVVNIVLVYGTESSYEYYFVPKLNFFTKIGPCGPELIWHLANKCSFWITYKVNVVQNQGSCEALSLNVEIIYMSTTI